MILWKEPEYKLITTKEQLLELSHILKKNIEENIPIGIDCETTGPHEESGLDYYHGWLLGISLCFDKNIAYYIPINHLDNKKQLVKDQLPIEVIKEIFGPIFSSGGLYIGHNIKFDYKFLYQSGIKLFPRFWDTSIAVQFINGVEFSKRALKFIIKDWVDVPIGIIRTFEDVTNGNAASLSPLDMLTYAANDSLFTYHLYEAMKPIIDTEYKKLFYEAEMPLLPILAHMELRGIRLDASYFKSQKEPLIIHRNKIEEEIKKEYDINVASPAQILDVFNKHFKDEKFPFLGKNSKPTTDEDFLKKILEVHKRNKDGKFYKFVHDILEFRKANKALNTYLIKYIDISEKRFKNGKVVEHILHTDYDQMKNSGRMSSSPNIQNIPRSKTDGDDILSIPIDVRRGFIARAGYKIIDADWKSEELRLAAVASQDPIMLDAYIKNPRDADLHTLTTQGIFNKQEVTDDERHIGKTLNFSILYGATEYNISNQLECSIEEAKEHIDQFFNFYQGIRDWKKLVEYNISQNGFTKTFYGRKRYLQPGYSPNMYDVWKYRAAVRELTNHIIQGTGADILKFAMVKLVKKFAEKDLSAHIISTTHDSVTVEAKEDIVDQVKQLMIDVMEFKIKDVLFPIDINIRNSFSKEY